MLQSRELRGDAQTDAGAPHFWKRNCAAPAAGLILEVGFAAAQFGKRRSQVAIPLDGVEREVEMRVEDEGRGHSLKSTSSSKTPPSPSIPINVSTTVHVRNVCPTVSPSDSFTIQNPPSLR